MRVFFLILILVNFSCSKRTTISYKDYLKGKTYIQIVKNSDKERVIFDPCDTNILKYKFDNNLYIDLGQDDISYSKWDIEKIHNDSVYIKVYEKPIWKELLKLKLDTTNNLLYNQSFVFIDSMKAINIPYVKEPCENCWDKEVCDEWEKKEQIKNNTFSSKWYGKYSHKTEPYKVDSLSSISIYYDISITKDSIAFLGTGYRTHFIDLCYAQEKADTLEIYYNKTLEGTDYNKDNKGVIAKLFKNKADYYIISPVIEDGEIQKDIPVLIQKD